MGNRKHRGLVNQLTSLTLFPGPVGSDPIMFIPPPSEYRKV